MRTSGLLLSSLNITEDEYHYKGLFILSAADKTLHVDMADLEHDLKVNELKVFFELEESLDDIRKILMDMVMDKADISSSIIEGEDFEETLKTKKVERMAKSLDMA